MQKTEIEAILTECPSPDTGCFASDVEAIDALIHADDVVIQADLLSATEAALTAGMAGRPVEDTVYYPVKLSKMGTNMTVDQDSHDSIEISVSDAEPTRGFTANSIFVDDYSDISETRQRVARCAYACGAAALNCPLRTEPPADAKDYDNYNRNVF